MRITKYGHCCLRIEEGGLTILTDPGVFSDGQNSATGIDVVLITHEHTDHYHVPSVKAVMANNPNAVIITNTAVAALLKNEGFDATVVDHGGHFLQGDVRFEARGEEKHAVIHPDLPGVQNTSYFIGDRLFYPGDAFVEPGRPVDVLALPIAAPWLKVSEPIDYAIKLKPTVAFPVHEGVLSEAALGFVPQMVERILGKYGVAFKNLKAGETVEF